MDTRITDATSGNVWVADEESGSFVSKDGTQRDLAQGWKVNVGFDNFVRVFTSVLIAVPGLPVPLVMLVGMAVSRGGARFGALAEEGLRPRR